MAFLCPGLVNVLPVNLPAIEASELSTDNLFELEDHSVALIDYESQYTELSKVKYINHIARFLKRYGAGSPTGKTRIKTASKRPKPEEISAKTGLPVAALNQIKN